MRELIERKPRRVLVVGSMGAGKTTAARELAAALGLPHHELDALYWQCGWQPLADDVFRERVATLVETEAWVIEGFDSRVGDLTWARAEAVVWLDVPLPVKLFRVVTRGLKRVATREALWNGNRETLARLFLGRDSSVAWTVRTHRRAAARYARAAAIYRIGWQPSRRPEQP